MREQERRYREALAAKESHDVRERTKRPTYDGGYVGLQPRPWCQVLERAFGVPAEDCLFVVSHETIYAVVADPSRLTTARATCGSRCRAGAEIARLGASSRRVALVFTSRRRFEAVGAAQRMGGDAAALAVLKPGTRAASAPGFTKSCAAQPP